MLSSIENTAAFDLARLDSKRWPYYMERVYTPLKEIDPISKAFSIPLCQACRASIRT